MAKGVSKEEMGKEMSKLDDKIKEHKKSSDIALNTIIHRISKLEKESETYNKEKEAWEKEERWETEKEQEKEEWQKQREEWAKEREDMREQIELLKASIASLTPKEARVVDGALSEMWATMGNHEVSYGGQLRHMASMCSSQCAKSAEAPRCMLMVLQFRQQDAFLRSVGAGFRTVAVAGYTAGQRAKHVPNAKYIAGASMLVGTSLTMALLVLLQVFPFTPRYIIPVSGMVVGNSMTVTGVTLKRLRDDIRVQQNLVETALALGATPRQATIKQVQRALVVALAPVIDNTKTVGLISLPGAMTGMIMGGASPIEAIQLQIVVMNMLLGANMFSSVMSTYLTWPFLFTKSFQLQTRVFATE
ncbi:hypothetical protein L7F22_042555 [Adiantum nelumboides]|nr:hypothetical protein [Adiantum nelumboides]